MVNLSLIIDFGRVILSSYRYRLDPVDQIVKRFISNGIVWKKKWIKIYLLSLWAELIQSQAQKIVLADFNRIQVRQTHCHAPKNGFLRLQILKMCKLRPNYPFKGPRSLAVNSLQVFVVEVTFYAADPFVYRHNTKCINKLECAPSIITDFGSFSDNLNSFWTILSIVRVFK